MVRTQIRRNYLTADIKMAQRHGIGVWGVKLRTGRTNETYNRLINYPFIFQSIIYTFGAFI